MANEQRAFRMSFASVYPLYVAKAEKKGRTRAEVDAVVAWLTGYAGKQLQRAIDSGIDLETFFAKAPRMNPKAKLITGVVCGVRVEEIADPLMRKIRQLDKLVDELAKGKRLGSVLRQPEPARSKAAEAPAARKKAKAPAKPAGKNARLLSGGNPQIARGDGDAPVQAWLRATPGWKGELGRWIDGVVTRAVPGVRKAVKWNSPFYGVEGKGWFLSFHCFTRYVKVTFFKGAALRPRPPIASKHEDVRYLDLREVDARDEAQLARWVKQAAAIPGWMA
jgi:hypothetical protein